MNWSALIRQRRENLKLTQMELAVKAGVSLPSIQNMEAGRANPSLKTLEAVFTTLGVGIEYTILDGSSLQSKDATAEAKSKTATKKPKVAKKKPSSVQKIEKLTTAKPTTVSDLTSEAVDSMALFDDQPSTANSKESAQTAAPESTEVDWPEAPVNAFDAAEDQPKNQDLGNVLWEVGNELGELTRGTAMERAGKLVKIFGKIADTRKR